MSSPAIEEILKEIEELLSSAGDLVPEAELAVEKLLNVVEALSSDKQSLIDEVERLKQQLQRKKKGKTTNQGDDPKQNSDHSSEKHRHQRQKPKRQSAGDRRTFKDLIIRETIECPVDPQELPPDAVRVEDEEVILFKTLRSSFTTFASSDMSTIRRPNKGIFVAHCPAVTIRATSARTCEH